MGARDAKRQKLGLPVTAVRQGLVDAPWADSSVKVQSTCGANAAKFGALMQASGRDDRLVRATPMSSTQLTWFARRLFREMNDEGEMPFSLGGCFLQRRWQTMCEMTLS